MFDASVLPVRVRQAVSYSGLREVVARLVFDSFSDPLAVGVRGASDAQQLLMQAEGIDLHLRISYAPRAIAGQLLQRYDERFDGRTGLGGLEIWIPIQC